MQTYKPFVIYHDNCADGFASAWAVWKRFSGEVDLHPALYGQPAPQLVGRRDIIIVDFSYPRAELLRLTRHHNVLVLDHHKTAAEDLAVFDSVSGWGEFAAEGERMRYPHGLGGIIRAVFDMNRSGAGLTWDFFNPTTPRPLLIDAVEDRDLWRFKMPESKALHAFVMALPFTPEGWDRLVDMCTSELNLMVKSGETLLVNHQTELAKLLEGAWRARIGGYVVPCINLPYSMMSDGIGKLAEGWPFAAGYFDNKDGRKWSLRSRDGVDVSAIAKAYGGGGHRNAAGFESVKTWYGDDTPYARDGAPHRR